ncbi:hypothetical protein GALMADRAFT_281783 [Galerina marginata CBS 339.88]|uniref:F-box domain-containing protein n=1 Tax=Galerina marginata (strain CBS 339.88) TaxID=685588 RepID=A0A067SKR6_GALM3|nr:hypothetical protein GALMADRAFT_281783 [Galerina marginata CBS 339.88]
MTRILGLSTEVLIEIFSSVFFTDLLSCKRTCQTFFDVISNSIELNYQIELQKSSMQNNPACSLSLPSRLKMIKDRELAWASFDFKFVTKVKVPSELFGVYDVSARVLLLGKESSNEAFEPDGIQSVRLPSSDDENVSIEWKNLDLGATILDFRPSIEAHDLVACVVLVPDKEDPEIWNINLVLRQYSDTSKNHCAALKPIIFICSALPHEEPPAVSIDISGDNLAIDVLFLDDSSMEATNNLFVFNWKSGESKTIHPTRASNSGTIFLREDILLQPNTVAGSLDIYRIPPSTSDSTPSRIQRLISLGLPDLSMGYALSTLSCRGEPGVNPKPAKYTPSTRPYTNDPNVEIMRFAMEIVSVYDETKEDYFVMITHRQALLDFLDLEEERQRRESTSSGARISWDIWGPRISRWFEVDSFSSFFTMDSFGQRYVRLTNPEGEVEEGSPEPRNAIHIFDFNPFHVKFMEIHGSGVVAGKPNLVLHVVGGGAEGLRATTAESICPGRGVFTRDIVGMLPYVELISDGWPFSEYKGLMIDEERLIAIRTDINTFRIQSVDVIYFG